MYISMALKCGDPCTFWPPCTLAESEGVRTPTGSPRLVTIYACQKVLELVVMSSLNSINHPNFRLAFPRENRKLIADRRCSKTVENLLLSKIPVDRSNGIEFGLTCINIGLRLFGWWLVASSHAKKASRVAQQRCVAAVSWSRDCLRRSTCMRINIAWLLISWHVMYVCVGGLVIKFERKKGFKRRNFKRKIMTEI